MYIDGQIKVGHQGIRACTTHRQEDVVGMFLESKLNRQIIQWAIFFTVYKKLFNALVVTMINYEYNFIYHCVVI